MTVSKLFSLTRLAAPLAVTTFHNATPKKTQKLAKD